MNRRSLSSLFKTIGFNTKYMLTALLYVYSQKVGDRCGGPIEIGK